MTDRIGKLFKEIFDEIEADSHDDGMLDRDQADEILANADKALEMAVYANAGAHNRLILNDQELLQSDNPNHALASAFRASAGCLSGVAGVWLDIHARLEAKEAEARLNDWGIEPDAPLTDKHSLVDGVHNLFRCSNSTCQADARAAGYETPAERQTRHEDDRDAKADYPLAPAEQFPGVLPIPNFSGFKAGMAKAFESAGPDALDMTETTIGDAAHSPKYSDHTPNAGGEQAIHISQAPEPTLYGQARQESENQRADRERF